MIEDKLEFKPESRQNYFKNPLSMVKYAELSICFCTLQENVFK